MTVQMKVSRAYTRLNETISLSYGLLYPSIEQTTWASTIPKFREQTVPYWLLCFISKRPSCGAWPFTRRTSEAKFDRNGIELKKRKHKYGDHYKSVQKFKYLFKYLKH